MKVSIIILIFSLFSTFVIDDEESNKGMAQVERIGGKEIYLFAEPIEPYTVVEEYNNSKNLISTCNLRNIVDSYLKRAQKDKVKFDALYMNTQEDIFLIKFTQGPKE